MKPRSIHALLILSLILGLSVPVFAQFVADPNDRLYTDLQMWADRGLTDRLPPLRPYPVQLVVKVLKEISSNGTPQDQKLASWYLSKIEPTNLHAVASSLARTDLSSGYLQLGLEGFLQGTVNPLITYSAQAGVAALSSLNSAFLLADYQRSLLDYINDTTVSPIASLYPRMTMVGSGTFGTNSIYLQAGTIRGSFGPFWGDNIVLSPTSPQSGQFSFVFHDNKMALTMALLNMTATDSSGGNLTSGKFLSLGSLEFYPINWLTLGAFDTVIWGETFKPQYLLPVVLYYVGGMGGFTDEAYIGLSGEFRLPETVKADFLLYVSDADFNDLIRLDFNTMIIAALQAGVSWTPNLPLLSRLSVTNMLIAPYMYTHYSYSGTTVNFLNYTNAGQNIGLSIQPDSDEIEVNALVRPIDWVDVNLFGRFIIHGNASAGIPGLTGDGSINDTGIVPSGGPYPAGNTFQPPYPLPAGYGYFRLLTQSVLEKVLQTGFDTKAYLETPVGEVEVELSYTFEILLDGSISGIGPVSGNNAINNYVGIGVTFTY